MITLNIILFAILCVTIIYIVLECIELYHEEKLTKDFIKSLEKGEKENDKCD